MAVAGVITFEPGTDTFFSSRFFQKLIVFLSGCYEHLLRNFQRQLEPVTYSYRMIPLQRFVNRIHRPAIQLCLTASQLAFIRLNQQAPSLGFEEEAERLQAGARGRQLLSVVFHLDLPWGLHSPLVLAAATDLAA